ncbi:hypothetical protein EBB07_06085 [Paenibacillaceae bacterium]|nr:hypothetical protein EBB07_06085 [Paenibacillaceae bacterium]
MDRYPNYNPNKQSDDNLKSKTNNDQNTDRREWEIYRHLSSGQKANLYWWISFALFLAGSGFWIADLLWGNERTAISGLMMAGPVIVGAVGFAYAYTSYQRMATRRAYVVGALHLLLFLWFPLYSLLEAFF